MKDLGKLFLAASLIVSPWLVAACGANDSGEKGGDDPPGGRSELCRSICQQIEECGTTDRAECVSVCQGDELTSTAALQVIDDCYSEEGCSVSTSSCLTSGIAGLEAGPAVEQFCEDMADYFTECSAGEFSNVQCRNLYSSVASGFLADVGECFAESCSVVQSCVTSVTDRYQTASGSIIELATGGGGTTTCPYTNDGECDEGIYCDYGTDTVDCAGSGECCASTDNCDWANDGICDCGGAYAWDANDCAVSTCPYTNDGECDEGIYCDYGTDTADCSGTTPCPYTNDGECDEGIYCDYGTDTADCSGELDCCTSANNCDWANDGVCDCSGAYAWDANDCAVSTCPYTNDGECDEGIYCDYGTDTADCSGELDCCTSANNCDWANDGFCDCNGSFAWDANDCAASTCPYTNDGECDEGTYCDYGTDTADCSGSCCSATDPCDWANDGICDCGGSYSWDSADCF